VKSAKLLIRCHARADLMSFFEEKPSVVGIQNPAFFTGVTTNEVVKVLKEEEALAMCLANRSADDVFGFAEDEDWSEGLVQNTYGLDVTELTQPCSPKSARGTAAKFGKINRILLDHCKQLDTKGCGRVPAGTLKEVFNGLNGEGQLTESIRTLIDRFTKDEQVDYASFVAFLMES